MRFEVMQEAGRVLCGRTRRTEGVALAHVRADMVEEEKGF